MILHYLVWVFMKNIEMYVISNNVVDPFFMSML